MKIIPLGALIWVNAGRSIRNTAKFWKLAYSTLHKDCARHGLVSVHKRVQGISETQKAM